MSYTTLISADELVHNQSNPALVLLDCRADLQDPLAGAAAFATSHIPVAQHADLDIDLSDKTAGAHGEFRGRHPLPAREKFIERLRSWGVNSDSLVVVYDAHGGMFAARLWWMLRWVGHSQVALLDGGLQAWQAMDFTMTSRKISPEPGNITLRPSLVPTVSVEDVMRNLAQPERIILDARAADRFRGENEIIDPVAGHIPGAKNRWFKDNLQADGRFKPADQLRTELSALITSPEKTILQCGSGASACVNLLAMEIAGLSGAALYPGSWSEWSADPARPVATGSAD
jgi:thiosulfate/3-mercaptopyruvate sulfurtransferase